MPRSPDDANTAVHPRWLSDGSLCKYIDTSRTSLHRLRKDPDSNFPKPVRLGSVNRTDADEVDKWMLNRAS